MSFNMHVTRQIPEEGINILKKFCQTVEVNPHDRPLTYDELFGQAKGRDAILTMLSDKIDAHLINKATNLRIIANYAVGYDNVDVKAATAKGIVVTNTPGVLTDSTADMAFGFTPFLYQPHSLK